ncbi:MAG: SGNH/GDSL hydrolase family protein [Nitrospira sp.]|nr:SGNH/GDSL hydrolase family protein [Nitrospira sp.]
MKPRLSFTLSLLALILVPALAFAQVNFPKNSYYVGMGDSVAAGEGAMPVTNGYVYRLYDEGVFGKKQEMDFSNIGIRGGRSWDLRDHQVPQVLCAEPEQRPTVVTITAGANDFFRGDQDLSSITKRVAQAVDLLLNNDGDLSLALGATQVLDPVLDPVTNTHRPCHALKNVTILVSNYYRLPHPVPAISEVLDLAVRGFDAGLRFWLQQVVVPSGSRVVVVDLYTPSRERQGLVTIQRRLGYNGPDDFDFHPTNLGHAFVAGEFKKAWNSLP